ncbi:MAG: hypothetical protein PF572_02415 [Patescibacteria group bacterium]|jgi:hypothetical protein|nr:hypothetical protein [Patescibacteria group bacterium]
MDKKNLQFHIESDDYFGTLATVIDLVRQNLNPFKQKQEKSTLEVKVEELIYLQKNYRIVKK